MNLNPDTAKEISCKNVLIYGHCKYEDKGCVFAHPGRELDASPPSDNAVYSSTEPNELAGNSQIPATTTESSFNARQTGAASPTPALPGGIGTPTELKRKFNLNTPSFQPSVHSVTNKFATLSPKFKEIPVFVPSGMESSSAVPSASTLKSENGSSSQSIFATRKFNTSTPSFTPSNPFETTGGNSLSNLTNQDGFQQYGQTGSSSNTSAFQSLNNGSQQLSQPSKQPNPYLNAPSSGITSGAVNTHSVNSADYMFHGQAASSYPLNHHLYAPAPPPRLTVPLKKYQTNANTLFIPNELRELLTKKNEATLQTLPHSSFPDHVGVYHSLVPLNSSLEHISSVYHLHSFVYKVLSNYDGLPYVLRRIDQGSKMRIANETPLENVKKWRALKNPNVVRLHDVFTSVSLSTDGEPSLFLAYDYYPLANTLQEQHITRRIGGKLEPITEDILRLYLVQLTSALISIHDAGLYAGSSISLSKVLVTNKNRVRIGAVGIDEILQFDSLEKLAEDFTEEEILKESQYRDITRLSKLMTDLATTMLPATLRGLSAASMISHLKNSSLSPSSDELANALLALHEADESFDLREFYRTHLTRSSLDALSALQDSTDYYESQLASELENARLFRLLAKINIVLDRPENNGDFVGTTSTIRLFRDYLFQTYNEFGKPAVDLSKILVNLNKLDVGVDEKLLLVSKEDDTCIIVTYKEVKDTLESSFRALVR